MRPTAERLDELREKLLNEELLSNRGLGNEVGFHIFDYPPEDELIVRGALPNIKKFVQKEHESIKIQEFDLYDIVLTFFEQRGYIEKNFKLEEGKGSEFLFKTMKKALRVATNKDWIAKYVRENWDEQSIVFITGVGKVFPLIRSHVVLNNLQTVVESKPLILFYPGTYDGGQLCLFSEFLDDHYYRAFRLVES